MKTAEEYQTYMDEIALRLGKQLEGVPLNDCSCLLARLLAWSLIDSHKGDRVGRDQALEQLITFIRRDFDTVDFGKDSLQ